MDKKELEKLEGLKYLSETDGGKYLIQNCKELTVANIEELVNSYQTKTLVEIQALCAKIQANLSMYRLLTGISEQVESIKKLYEENTKKEES